MSLTAERERVILAWLYGKRDMVWLDRAADAPGGALFIEQRELRALNDKRLAHNGYGGYLIIGTAQGRTRWEQLGRPTPEDLA